MRGDVRVALTPDVGQTALCRGSTSAEVPNNRGADAIHEFFRQRAAETLRNLAALFRRGRISLAIGLTCLAACVGTGDLLVNYFPGNHFATILRESLLIGGWVAMWRPLEIFLYDWWPIRAEARLCTRLSAMPVRIVYADSDATDAWRRDWPAMPASAGTTIQAQTVAARNNRGP